MPTVNKKPITLVIAGNSAQFRIWKQEDHEARMDARYVYNEESVRGFPSGTVLRFIGTYYTREDLGVIVQYATAFGFNTVFEKSA